MGTAYTNSLAFQVQDLTVDTARASQLLIMYYVIFEGTVPDDKLAVSEQYYKTLLPELQKVSGFIEETGFGSPHTPSKSVTISLWEDEAAVRRWRNESTHLRIQQKASTGVFESYRIRLGPALASDQDYNMALSGAGQCVVLYQREKHEGFLNDDITSLVGDSPALEVKEALLDCSVYQASQALWVSSWHSEAAACRFEKLIRRTPGDAIQRFRVLRDYGKFDRKDAPHEKPGLT